ncbi:MAG: MotA/TolQ/ExbB proton channel family protein [Planctomycetota bacterium]|jgi:biopolymer transport protein ExbB/TolQ
MDTAMAEQLQSNGVKPRQSSLLDRVLTSPLLWGGLASIVFYWAVRQLPGFASWGQTLFCGHPLAYATTTLFWVGIASLTLRMLTVPRELRALDAIPEIKMTSEKAVAAAKSLQAAVDRTTPGLRNSLAGERLTCVVDFVLGRRSAEGLNGHLQYLAEFAGERLHHSYGLVRTITWAVPILGFLGTVIGITQAIQNLDPAQLQSSFGMVAEGLGVAFGTTALALGLSLLLVFGTYLVEKSERSILADVELRTLELTTRLFPVEQAEVQPIVAAETEAAQQILEQTEALIAQHVTAWKGSLGEIRERWAATLTRHQSELDATLRSAFEESVSGHLEQFGQQRASQQVLQRSLEQLATAQDGLIKSQRDIIASQLQIADRLDAEHSNEALEETLHTLSAAVHLLTTRVTPKAA